MKKRLLVALLLVAQLVLFTSMGWAGEYYYYNLPSQVHVAVANTVHWDLWNGSTKAVRVISVLQIPDIATVVTGVAFTWTLRRTTTSGTGGTPVAAWLPFKGQTTLDSNITLRSKPTGGVGGGDLLLSFNLNSDETNTGNQMFSALASGGMCDLIPLQLRLNGQGVLLEPNSGMCCIQVTSSNAGNTGWLIGIGVE